MICWLSNGEGPLGGGGGGQHYKPSVVEGVDFEIKIWPEMTGLPKKIAQPPPPQADK